MKLWLKIGVALFLLIPLLLFLPYGIISVQTNLYRKAWTKPVHDYIHVMDKGAKIYDMKIMRLSPSEVDIYLITDCTGIDPTHCPTPDTCATRHGRAGEEIVFQKSGSIWKPQYQRDSIVWTDCGSADDYTVPPFFDH